MKKSNKPWGAPEVAEIEVEQDLGQLLDWLIEIAELNGYYQEGQEQYWCRKAIATTRDRIIELHEQNNVKKNLL